MSESKARPGLAWRRAGVALTLLAMAALAFAARVVPTWDDVFQDDGGVHLYGVDPYYHLRHATSAAKHFPTLLRRDAATHFPLGQHSDAAGGFDLAIAAASLAIAGEFDPATVERVAAWTPPVVFLLAFAGLFAWARRSLGEGPGLFACAMLALYPGSLIQRSLLGFADHHVAEVALAAWIAWGLTRAVDRAERDADRWYDTWPAVLATVALVFTWIGAPVVWLLTGLALLFTMLIATVQDRDPRPLARVGARYGAAVVGIALALAWLDPNLVLKEKLLVRIALAGLAYFPGLPIAAHGLVRLRMRTGSAGIAAFLGGLTALVVTAALLIDPDVERMVRRLVDPSRAMVAEHRAVDSGLLQIFFGGSGLLAFVGLGLACAALQRRLLPARHALGLALATLWLGLWWKARDFDYTSGLYVSWLAAYALVAARDLGFVPRAAAARGLSVAALALVVVLPLWPLGLARPPWPVAEERRQLLFVHEGWDEALAWLRANTPPEPFDPLDPAPGWDERDLAYPPGSYGVVTGWEHGNLVALHGRRFVRHSRFPTRRMARWWLATDEESALGQVVAEDPVAEPLRYVVVDARQSGESFIADHFLLVGDPHLLVSDAPTVEAGAGGLGERRTFGPAFDASLAARLVLDDGEGLGRMRLVYESPHTSYQSYYQTDTTLIRRTVLLDTPEARRQVEARLRVPGPVSVTGGIDHGPHVLSSVKIYEIVAGARLRGRATPGARVVAELPLEADATRRRFRYRTTARADVSGAFTLRVPYPTEPPRGESDVTARAGYVIAVERGDGSRRPIAEEVRVPVAAVREGLTIEVSETAD